MFRGYCHVDIGRSRPLADIVVFHEEKGEGSQLHTLKDKWVNSFQRHLGRRVETLQRWTQIPHRTRNFPLYPAINFLDRLKDGGSCSYWRYCQRKRWRKGSNLPSFVILWPISISHRNQRRHAIENEGCAAVVVADPWQSHDSWRW